MSEPKSRELSGVAETLLITLYVRALESQRPDALIRDEKAVELVRELDYDFARIKQIRMDEDDKTAIILRTKEFDRLTYDFLARYPHANVVHIGCGLNARFERVDNGLVEWFDLDLPNVIELRAKYLGGDGPRYHLLAGSAFDLSWLEKTGADRERPFLFLAEGVLMYFEAAEVKSLVLALQERVRGSELVFDAFSPYAVRMNNLRFAVTKFGARYHWALGNGRDLEAWSHRIRLLDEWFPFDAAEPRLEHVHWMRHFPFLAHVMGIYHYQLG